MKIINLAKIPIMRKIYLLLVTLLTFVGFSASAAKENLQFSSLKRDEANMWSFEKVIEMPGESKAVIFDRMKKWVLTNIKTSDKNTMLDDPAQNELITTATIELGGVYSSQTSISFKIHFEFKDGKMRVSCSSFTFYSLGNANGVPNIIQPLEEYRDVNVVNKKIEAKVDEKFPAFINFVESGAAKKANKDW